MKFPKRVKYRGRAFATIYDKSAKYPSYRVVWNIHGKRRMKAFAHLGGKDGAKEYAESVARDLSRGSQAPALTSTQASDALAAFERLEQFRAATGHRYSLLSLTSEFIDAASKLGGHSLHEAIEGFLRTAASVKRKDVTEGVQEFIAGLEPRTRAKQGERAQLSAHYVYVLGLRLTRFADTFRNTAICDLTKEHLDTFFRAKALADFSPLLVELVAVIACPARIATDDQDAASEPKDVADASHNARRLTLQKLSHAATKHKPLLLTLTGVSHQATAHEILLTVSRTLRAKSPSRASVTAIATQSR